MLKRIKFVLIFFIGIAVGVASTIHFLNSVEVKERDRNRVLLSESINSIKNLSSSVILDIIDGKQITSQFLNKDDFKNIDVIYLSSAGTIFFKTTYHQVVFLYPTKTDDATIEWKCIASPSNEAPKICTEY